MKKRILFISALFFSLLFLFAHSSYAIYSWVDEKGVIHFSDNPKPTKEREKEPEDEKQQSTSPSSEAGATAPVRQDQKVKRPIVAPSTQQPEAPQKVVPTAQVPASTQVQKPGDVTSRIPEQPTSKGTLTIPETIAPPQPVAAIPTGKEVSRPETPVPFTPKHMPPTDASAALMAEFMSKFLLVFAGIYLYMCLCSYLIAKKLDVPAAWTAWIPIIQIWTFMRSAGKPLWWILLLLIPFVGGIVMVYLYMCITENLGKNKWLGLLMLIPFVNLVFFGVLAFSSKEE